MANDVTFGDLDGYIWMLGNLGQPRLFRNVDASYHYNDVVMREMASQITSVFHCLLNHIFGCRSKKASKLRGEFPAQRASNAEKFPFDDVIIITEISYSVVHHQSICTILQVVIKRRLWGSNELSYNELNECVSYCTQYKMGLVDEARPTRILKVS